MTIYTETKDITEFFSKAGDEGIVKYWQWRVKGGAFESAKTSVRFVNLVEQAIQEQNTTTYYGLSFTTTQAREEKRIAVIPELEGISTHNPAMTSIIRSLMRNFWAIVVSKALQASFPVDKTSIAVFNDQAEERLQVVLRIFTGAKASQAVAFWESLEKDINQWVSQLNDRNRLIFLRDISLRIHWQ